MPELPEVETIARQLNQVLTGKKVASIEILRERSFFGDPETLKSWEIERVSRKSKVIEIYFKGKSELVIVHLKMTGQLIFIKDDEKTQELKNSKLQEGEGFFKNRIVGGHPTADWVKELPSKHTRVIWDFTDGSKLFFNDMRVFGWMKLVEKTQELKNSRYQIPDVIDKEFTLAYFSSLLPKTSKAIKLLILDQEKMGGVGNIYANDALYLAGIRPERKANSLTPTEQKKLYLAIKEVIELGIKCGGASASNYVNVSGLGGTYQDHFLVYKRDGQLCKQCGGKIQKTRIGGRGTFFCPNCQK